MKGYFWKHEQCHIIPRIGIYVDPIAKNWWLSIDLSWLTRTASLDIKIPKFQTK
ncbi:MAG: hypothetical protein JEY96_16810 [Bacteroidales bacterium]|nr:hypothetical protein [Bacteroidales bacterium]